MAIKKKKIEVNELTCNKCGMVWQIAIAKTLPKVCYGCKSPKWNGENTGRKGEAE